MRPRIRDAIPVHQAEQTFLLEALPPLSGRLAAYAEFAAELGLAVVTFEHRFDEFLSLFHATSLFPRHRCHVAETPLLVTHAPSSFGNLCSGFILMSMDRALVRDS